MTFSFFSIKKPVFLVYGSKGWIGSLFCEYLASQHPKITFIQGSSRIDNEQHVTFEIKKTKPTHVISFTGRTHGTIEGKMVNTIDYLEHPGKLVENVRDNLVGPIILADICKKYNIHYTYLGTGCIFNSEMDSDIFTEQSSPNYFGSSYSIVKGYTDILMKRFSHALNLRIRMPISSKINDRNFITKITKYSKICSIPNSMTVLDDFFPIFVDLMLKRKSGTYNCTNPGTTSHNEILEAYREIIDHSFTWVNMTLEEQNKMLLSARSNNELCTDKIKNEYPNLKGIKTSVVIALNKMKIN
jgi:dTDP-4-dehydrorhamnose reductase